MEVGMLNEVTECPSGGNIAISEREAFPRCNIAEMFDLSLKARDFISLEYQAIQYSCTFIQNSCVSRSLFLVLVSRSCQALADFVATQSSVFCCVREQIFPVLWFIWIL